MWHLVSSVMLHCVSSFAVFFFDGIGLKCVLGVLALRAVAWNPVPDNDQIGTRPAACSLTVLDTSVVFSSILDLFSS